MQPFFYMHLMYIRCMLLYNITFIIESGSESGIIEQVRNLFEQSSIASSDNPARFLKMQDSPHEGSTYRLQVKAQNEEGVIQFQQKHLSGLKSSLQEHFPGKVLYFESIMEYII